MRFQNASLALGALVTYQINALIYRPAEGEAEKELLNAASQHVYDVKSSSYPIMYERGAYFLSDIADDGVSLPSARLVGPNILLSLYRRHFMEDIEAELHGPPSQNETPNAVQTTSHSPRMTRKRKTTSRVFNDTSSSSSDEDDTGAAVITPIIRGINGLSDLLRQFPSDILQLVPKPKSVGEKPWFLLDRTEVTRAKVEIFQSPDILRVFRQAQYTILDSTEWKTAVFERYFPPRNFKRPKTLQHYPSAAYYRKWENLMNEAIDEDTANTIRETVRIWFSKLLWVPFPANDRMWSTKRAKGSEWQMVPPGAPVGLCPRLAINVDLCDKQQLRNWWKDGRSQDL